MTLREIIQNMFHEGQKDEELVMMLTEAKFGGKTQRATREEDIFRHVDFWWFDKTNKPFGVDVKGVKRSRRNDATKDDSIHWVELQNVRGNKGWVYGDAVYIAFMTNHEVLFVPRKRLATFTEDKIQGKDTTRTCPQECYIPYQRAGRNDIVVKVPTADLRSLAQHIIAIDELTDKHIESWQTTIK